jgi:hypothetical protein
LNVKTSERLEHFGSYPELKESSCFGNASVDCFDWVRGEKTGGNADRCENKGLTKKEVRNSMKTWYMQIDAGGPGGNWFANRLRKESL